MDLYSSTWSETREDNNLAPPNGFLSGEDAGDVKLTFREIMAACKREWDLSHPTMTVTGDGDAIILTPAVPVTQYATGQVFAATMDVDIGNAGNDVPTFNVSSLGAKKIYVQNFAGGYTQVGKRGREVKAGEVALFTYDSSLDSGNGGFILLNQPQYGPRESIECILTSEGGTISHNLSAFIFRLPYGFRFTDFRASLNVAQTSGTPISLIIYYFNRGDSRTYIIASDLTIDNGETTSVTSSVPYVVSPPLSGGPLQNVPFPDDEEIIIGINTVGDGTARGLKVTLIGHRSI